VADTRRLIRNSIALSLILCFTLGCKESNSRDGMLANLRTCLPSTLFLGDIWYKSKIYCFTSKDYLIPNYTAWARIPESFKSPLRGNDGSFMHKYAIIEIYGSNGGGAGMFNALSGFGNTFGNDYLDFLMHLLRSVPSASMTYAKYTWITKDGFMPLWLNWHFNLNLDKHLDYLTDPEHGDEQAVKYVLPCVKRDALRN